MKSGYLLGIGSNIDPEQNIVAIVEELLDVFPQITLSRVLRLPPIGMTSIHDFLNLAAFIATDMSQQDLKQVCNSIEEKLGRDRSDPDRKHKDHAADIDILAKVTLPTESTASIINLQDEQLFLPLVEEINTYLLKKPYPSTLKGIRLVSKQSTFGETATTINR